MKKIFSFALMLLAGITMISCSTDRDSNPTIKAPTTFTLNTPSHAEQYIQLEGNTVSLSWSQPDYNFNALATYQIQVGIVTDEGIKWDKKDIVDDAGTKIGEEDEYLDDTFTECRADIKGSVIAMAINEIDGLQDISLWEGLGLDKVGYREIAFRVRSSIRDVVNVEAVNSAIISNPVTYKHMESYPIVKKAASMYLVGNCSDWKEPNADNEAFYADWTLEETKIGSKIFSGTFTIPAGALTFRFYDALKGWDAAYSYGADEPDMNDVPCEFTDGVFDFEGVVHPGQSNWSFGTCPGGSLTFTLDLNTNSLRIVINN